VRSLTRLSLFIILFVGVVTLLSPDTAYAQRDGRGRGGTRAVPVQRVVRVAPVRSTVIVGGYSRRYYYDPFFYGYYGFSPWFAYPHAFYPGYYGYGPPYGPYGYYGGVYEHGSSVRVQVTPRHAEVYVNGYMAGTVDDFDGFLQRLRLPPGQHELVLYLDGFQTVRQNLHLPPGATYRIRHTMVPLAAGQTPEPRPQPGGGGAPPFRNDPQPPYQPAPPPYGVPRYPGPDPAYGPGGPPQRYEASGFGTLRIRVQPGDAVVLVDGEEWRGPETRDALVVQLSEGSHRVEVRKDGYELYSTDIRVRQGETTPLNISLPRRGGEQ